MLIDRSGDRRHTGWLDDVDLTAQVKRWGGVSAPLLLALTAGMLGAVNPCGFALLPAYLSLLVAGDPPDSGAAAVGRALRRTAALTVGYVAVFGAFGLVARPGRRLAAAPAAVADRGARLSCWSWPGGWLLAGRSLPAPGYRLRAPAADRLLAVDGRCSGWRTRWRRSAAPSAPFLAIVVASLRAGSTGTGWRCSSRTPPAWAWSIGVAALAVALVRAAVVARLRVRPGRWCPGSVARSCCVAGGYVAYYGWYELRLAAGRRDARGTRSSKQRPSSNKP